MLTSDSIELLATALSKAQGEFKSAVKNTENPFFKSKYADLEATDEATKAAMVKNGLSHTQMTKVVDGKLYLTTRVMHSSGQWIEGDYPIVSEKASPQAIGSAVSYARRYALNAALGVVSTDDDGEGAMDRTTQPQPVKVQPASLAPKKDFKKEIWVKQNPNLTQTHANEIQALAKAKGMNTTELTNLLRDVTGKDKWLEIPVISFGMIKTKIEEFRI